MSKFRMLIVPVFMLSAMLVTVADPPDADEILDRRITLNLQEAPAEQLFGLFAQLLGADLELEFEGGGPVNFVFDDIKVRTSLNALCESVGCHWELEPGAPPVLRFTAADVALEEKRAMATDRVVSLDLEDASAPRVFQLFSKILKTELAIDTPIEESTITIKRDDQPISKLLDEICEDLGCRWKLVGDGPVTLRITRQEG